MKKLAVLITGVAYLVPLQAAVLPYGSTLEVRLLHQVGSQISHVGDPVEASLITPFYYQDKLLVPAGATVTGTVEHINRLGFGLRHSAARLDLHFTHLHLLDGQTVNFDARVASVETARESVRKDGAVIGINPSANFSTGVSAMFTVLDLAEREFHFPIVAIKFLAGRAPDAEIAFPAGTEMLLHVASNVQIVGPSADNSEVPMLSTAEIAEVQNVLSNVPQQQTNRGHNHPSDLVNIMLLGDRDEVIRSFHAAGWTAPESRGILAFYHVFHCVVERKGNSKLPMSNLRLNGNVPDIAFEKNLDTFAKRHHIRLWYDENAQAWLGAATEDTGYKWTKAHITHATDSTIDNERAKIVNDLAFTGCIDHGALIPRASLKPAQDSSSSIITDGDIAVLHLNSCQNPRAMPTDPPKPVPVQAIRIIAAVAIDLVRSNPVSVGMGLTKSIIDAGHVRPTSQMQASRVYTRPSAVANASAVKSDGSLALR